MGDVAITLKVMPKSPEIDTTKMKSEISSAVKKLGINIKSIEEKPIAFGLKCIELLLVMPDQGGTDKIDETIRKIQGVASIESGDITLL